MMTTTKIIQILRQNKHCKSVPHLLQPEDGIALVMVLVFSAIGLAIMAALIYMLTTSTQISGLQKRYSTAYEAGVSGKDIMYQIIAVRGNPNIPLITNFNIPALNVAGFDCLANKLINNTVNWNAACNNTLSIVPVTPTTYDALYDLGTYRVYAKVVDTVLGNSAAELGLVKGSVVSTDTGTVKIPSRPFLYSIELDAENQANPDERAKISVLYAY